MTEIEQDTTYIALASEIVSAYVSNNSVPASDLPGLIGSIHASLSKIAGKPSVTEEAVRQPATPPVSIRKSITDDYLICLEDGKRFKSLKRHLHSVYGMSPDEYRQKWGLPRDYPMVAPAYAKARSALAKEMGLGASRRKAPVEEPEVEAMPTPVPVSEPEPVTPPKKPPGRRKKAVEA